MRNSLIIIFCFFSFGLAGQDILPEVYGYRHLQTLYKGDIVDILIRSKKGEEQKKKPLLLFCQGSLPIPLVISYKEGGKESTFPVFVFNPDSLANDFHLAIISKPYVPIIVNQQSLASDFTYHDATGSFPAKYIERNLPDYYVNRNIAVVKFLQTQSWVAKTGLVVAGHSEGSTIALKIASRFRGVSALIYAGGNPAGRILSIIQGERANEKDTISRTERIFRQWENIVDSSKNMDTGKGDTFKATYDFSMPLFKYFQKLTIPVLVAYGTKDASCSYNDLLRIEMAMLKKKNFTFKAYTGTEHNYFPLKPNGETNFDVFNWNKVAEDWRRWLKSRP